VQLKLGCEVPLAADRHVSHNRWSSGTPYTFRLASRALLRRQRSPAGYTGQSPTHPSQQPRLGQPELGLPAHLGAVCEGDG